MSIAVFSGKNCGGVFWQKHFGAIWGSYVQLKTIFSYCKGIVFGWIYELKCEKKVFIIVGTNFIFCFDNTAHAPKQGPRVNMRARG